MPKPNIGQGDDGKSVLFGTGEKFPKDNIQFEALGTLDELNSHIGYACSIYADKSVKELLLTIERHLFTIQAHIGVQQGYKTDKVPAFLEEYVVFLEDSIRQYEQDLPELSNFILPTGTPQAAYLHICRTLTRRLERRLVELSRNMEYNEFIRPYINRLADVFFALARFSNYQAREKDRIWNPNSNRLK